MHDEQNGDSPVLTDLRRRLDAGLARMRLNKTVLAGRPGGAGAYDRVGGLPERRAGALAGDGGDAGPRAEAGGRRVTGLQQDAAGGGERPGPGRLIGEWEPYLLEVHPAGMVVDGSDVPEARVLPGYVRREHDRVPAEAVTDVAAGRTNDCPASILRLDVVIDTVMAAFPV